MKPVNESLYNSKTNYAERHGCVVMRGTEEAGRHLDSLCKDGEIVDAAYIPGAKVIVFRENLIPQKYWKKHTILNRICVAITKIKVLK